MTKIFGDKVEIPTNEKVEDILRESLTVYEKNKKFLEGIKKQLAKINS